MERYKLKLKRKKNIISLRGGGLGNFQKQFSKSYWKGKLRKGSHGEKKKEKVEEVLSTNQVLC